MLPNWIFEGVNYEIALCRWYTRWNGRSKRELNETGFDHSDWYTTLPLSVFNVKMQLFLTCISMYKLLIVSLAIKGVQNKSQKSVNKVWKCGNDVYFCRRSERQTKVF